MPQDLHRRAETGAVTKEDISVLKNGWLTDNVRPRSAFVESCTDVSVDYCFLGRVRSSQLQDASKMEQIPVLTTNDLQIPRT
jgi:hypothetical protein